MEKLTGIFNTVCQAAKDTANGFHFDNFWGGANAVLGGYYAFRCATVLSTAGVGSVLIPPVLMLGLCFGFAWHEGKQRREAGMPPRYIP